MHFRAKDSIVDLTLGKTCIKSLTLGTEMAPLRNYNTQYIFPVTIRHILPITTRQETKQMKAIRIHKPGGPEVMQYEDITLDAPNHGEVRLRHTAIGLNYLDTYHRSGAYPLPLPSGLGFEAAGGCGSCW